MNFCKIKILVEKNLNYNSRIFTTKKDIAEYISNIENLSDCAEEYCFIICLNSKNNIVGYSEIAKGGLSDCTLDLKTIFKNILLCNATRFILIHNHPSGDPTPSASDIKATKQLQEASQLMCVEFLDHLVIGGNGELKSCLIQN